MRKFLRQYRYGWILIFYLVLSFAYFIPKYVPLSEATVIHVALDDLIPFCEIFILPYVFWYVYVAGTIVFFLFTDRETFIKLLMSIFIGMAIATAAFFICPTAIDFRPETFERQNFFTWLTSLIYSTDPPINVCPSIHCLNAFATHIAIQCSPSFRRRPGVWVPSMVISLLICLSTLFIKQHSVVDMIVAAVLEVPIFFIVYKIPWKFLKPKKEQASSLAE